MARGSQNGVSNNPAGKPAGATTKLSLSIRSRIVEKVTDNLDDYFDKLSKLEGRDYIRCMTELLKLIVPRPLNDEESNAFNIHSEMIKRLFNNQ